MAQCANGPDIEGFQCQSGYNCIWLAGQTTILCCPPGNSCNTISIIPCDISLQDVTKHPSAAIKTTVFDTPLPTCGQRCCPFGYECQNESCQRASDQSNAPTAGQNNDRSTTSAVTTEGTTATTYEPTTATTLRSASVSTTAGPAASDNPSDSPTSPTYSDKMVLPLTIALSISLVVIIAVITWFLWRRYHGQHEKRRRAGGRLGGDRGTSHSRLHRSCESLDGFEKPELDSQCCEVKVQPPPNVKYDVRAIYSPIELPATPIQRRL